MIKYYIIFYILYSFILSQQITLVYFLKNPQNKIRIDQYHAAAVSEIEIIKNYISPHDTRIIHDLQQLHYSDKLLSEANLLKKCIEMGADFLLTPQIELKNGKYNFNLYLLDLLAENTVRNISFSIDPVDHNSDNILNLNIRKLLFNLPSHNYLADNYVYKKVMDSKEILNPDRDYMLNDIKIELLLKNIPQEYKSRELKDDYTFIFVDKYNIVFKVYLNPATPSMKMLQENNTYLIYGSISTDLTTEGIIIFAHKIY